jgi:hypothetical protein
MFANTKICGANNLTLNKERMKPKEKTMLEFAGYCFIHKPELANDLNTLIAGFINKPLIKINSDNLNKDNLK